MATLRLLSSISPVNFLCIRKLTTQDTIASKFRRSIEKDILPPKPKKPLTPFIQYFLSVKDKLQKEHPGVKYQDIVKKASEQWVKVEPTVKQNLQKLYIQQQSTYKQKLADYQNSITDEQKLLIRKELIKKEDAWEKSQVKQKLAELGKPKRPLTAFFLFMQSKRVAKDPKISPRDWVSHVSNEWKNMSAEVKSKYTTEATRLLEKYKIEVKKWEEDMAQAGHHDLLKLNIKSKRNMDIDKYFSTIGTRNKENIKIGWGTDTIDYTSRNVPVSNNGPQNDSIRSLVLYNNRKNLQAVMKYPRNMTKDASINNVKQSQLYIFEEIYKNFASIWKQVLTLVKKTSKNWKMKLTNSNGPS